MLKVRFVKRFMTVEIQNADMISADVPDVKTHIRLICE